MSKVAVITDSTAGLTPEMVAELEMAVIPLNVHWGADTYLDGVTLHASEFYEWLPLRKDFPTTSQPSAGEFAQFISDVAARRQTDAVLVVTVSSDLSGTYNSAVLAQQMVTDIQVAVLDSRTLSMAAGFQAMHAARLAQQGLALPEIVAALQDAPHHSQLLCAVDTLEYLHRGGRIGGAARFLGSLLNLKPILCIENGRIEPLEKVRSRRKALQRIVEIAVERLAGRPPSGLAIVHTGRDEDIAYMLDLVNAHLKPARLYTTILTPVVGVHSGPGTVGLAYYTE